MGSLHRQLCSRLFLVTKKFVCSLLQMHYSHASYCRTSKSMQLRRLRAKKLASPTSKKRYAGHGDSLPAADASIDDGTLPCSRCHYGHPQGSRHQMIRLMLDLCSPQFSLRTDAPSELRAEAVCGGIYGRPLVCNYANLYFKLRPSK